MQRRQGATSFEGSSPLQKFELGKNSGLSACFFLYSGALKDGGTKHLIAQPFTKRVNLCDFRSILGH